MNSTQSNWSRRRRRPRHQDNGKPGRAAGPPATGPRSLIPYSEKLLERLHDEDDAVVMDSLAALGRVARLTPAILWQRRDEILRAYERGSRPVRRAALGTLAALACSAPSRRNNLAPFLVETLRSCDRRDLATWTETVVPALPGHGRAAAAGVLSQRLTELGDGGRRRIDPLLRRHYWSSGLATFPGIFLTTRPQSA